MCDKKILGDNLNLVRSDDNTTFSLTIPAKDKDDDFSKYDSVCEKDTDILVTIRE